MPVFSNTRGAREGRRVHNLLDNAKWRNIIIAALPVVSTRDFGQSSVNESRQRKMWETEERVDVPVPLSSLMADPSQGLATPTVVNEMGI